MNRFKIKVMVVLFLFMLPSACRYNDDVWRRGSDKIDDVAPEVSSISLSNGAGISSPLVIRFNDDMMHGTLHGGTIVIDDGSGTVPGTFAPSLVVVTGGYETQVSFSPSAGYDGTTAGNTFMRSTTYDITVSTDVRDYYGNFMASDYFGSFTTAADLELMSSSIDVVTNPADHRIRLNFNDPPNHGVTVGEWQINVSGDHSSGTLNTPFHYNSSGVTLSGNSIFIPTGVAFTGATVTVDSFVNFSAAVDSAGLDDPSPVSITVP